LTRKNKLEWRCISCTK